MTAFLIVNVVFLMSANMQAEPVLKDMACDGGFRLSAVQSSMRPVEIGRVLAGDILLEPKWRLCQWGTAYSLEGVASTVSSQGARALANAAKEIVVFQGGLSGDGLRLAVHGGVEYGEQLRAQGQPWPHLLVEQKIDDLRLERLGTLNFALEFRVEICVSATDRQMDPSLHTAHITAFWNVHNRNAQSKDFQDMIWFGVPLFDARYPIPPGHQAVDAGKADATGKFIYTVPGARFYDKPVKPGEWNKVACDLLPLLGEALEASRAKGFLKNTTKDDLAITGFNLGWEVPGSYDCAILLRHLKMDAVSSGE